MPPKPKFTKGEIITAALHIVSQNGIEGLTAQTLKTALSCSASPIFTVFASMREIQNEVRAAAMQRFESYMEDTTSPLPIFKQIGIKMILFGMQEPKLYQLLFMQENQNASSFHDIFGNLGKTAELCIATIQKEYRLSTEQAQKLFENVWIYTFGIGALCATRVCRFSEQQISEMLTTEFQAMMLLIKSD